MNYVVERGCVLWSENIAFSNIVKKKNLGNYGYYVDNQYVISRIFFIFLLT